MSLGRKSTWGERPAPSKGIISAPPRSTISSTAGTNPSILDVSLGRPIGLDVTTRYQSHRARGASTSDALRSVERRTRSRVWPTSASVTRTTPL